MSDIWMGISPERAATRVIAMAGPSETILKARLLPVPGHPRAMATLLEAVALWQGAKVRAVLSVADGDGGSVSVTAGLRGYHSRRDHRGPGAHAISGSGARESTDRRRRAAAELARSERTGEGRCQEVGPRPPHGVAVVEADDAKTKGPGCTPSPPVKRTYARCFAHGRVQVPRVDRTTMERRGARAREGTGGSLRLVSRRLRRLRAV
jgi:hypothetical protein